MDAEYYLKEAYNILGYRVLEEDPLPLFKKKMISLISKAYDQQILTKQEKYFILIESPSTPFFYFLPKLHKNPLKPPGRPLADMD